eukprot:TRINITY_DN34192_c0_g1_i1.p1 TRINITY_DN34192_c0_g1~~TRINITY_DN34192_c0_g1_i1.p1  ORF type:complete len:913 (+),score=226.60 TRINITY_DN34192_c0_g1_i1:208-2946(+)
MKQSASLPSLRERRPATSCRAGRAPSPVRRCEACSREGSPERPHTSVPADAVHFSKSSSIISVSSSFFLSSSLGRSSRPKSGRPSTGRRRTGGAGKQLPKIDMSASALSFEDIFHRSCSRALHSRASKRHTKIQAEDQRLFPGAYCSSKHLLRNYNAETSSTAKRASFASLARAQRSTILGRRSVHALPDLSKLPAVNDEVGMIDEADPLVLPSEQETKIPATVEELDDLEELAELLKAPEKAETMARLEGKDFSEREVAGMKNVFDRFVQVGSDDVHEDDLEAILDHLGYLKMSKEAVQEMVTATTQYSTLNFEEFMAFMQLAKKHEQAEVRRSFEAFDADHSGELSAGELADLLKSLGITPFRSTIADALAVVDEDGSGSLNFSEFGQLLMIYKKTEGFSQGELKKLHRIFRRFASWHGKPPRRLLSADHIKEALMYMFGTHCAEIASSLIHNVARGGMNFRNFVVWARRLREAEVEAYRQEFVNADEDGGGLLDAEEIAVMLARLGYTPIKSMIIEVLACFDTDGGGSLDFDEFVNMMQLFRTTDGFTREELEDYSKLFNEFDSDSKGSINAVQAGAMLRRLGIRTEIERAEAMLRTVDRDASNSLDFQEFLRLMRLHREEALTKIKKVFSKFVGEDGVVGKDDVFYGLLELDYPAAIAKQSSKFFKGFAGALLDFDGFVAVADLCRMFLASKIRKQAGFSDEQLENFTQLFKALDADDSGELAKQELVEFCKARGLPLQTKEHRNELFRMVEEARASARAAGLTAEECGQERSPEVPYWVFIHLMRVLQTRKDIEFAENEVKTTYELSQEEIDQLREAFARKQEEHLDSLGGGEATQKVDLKTIFELVEELGIQLNALLREQIKIKLFMALGEVIDGRCVDFESFTMIVTWLGNTALGSAAAASNAHR